MNNKSTKKTIFTVWVLLGMAIGGLFVGFPELALTAAIVDTLVVTMVVLWADRVEAELLRRRDMYKSASSYSRYRDDYPEDFE